MLYGYQGVVAEAPGGELGSWTSMAVNELRLRENHVGYNTYQIISINCGYKHVKTRLPAFVVLYHPKFEDVLKKSQYRATEIQGQIQQAIDNLTGSNRPLVLNANDVIYAQDELRSTFGTTRGFQEVPALSMSRRYSPTRTAVVAALTHNTAWLLRDADDVKLIAKICGAYGNRNHQFDESACEQAATAFTREVRPGFVDYEWSDRTLWSPGTPEYHHMVRRNLEVAIQVKYRDFRWFQYTWWKIWFFFKRIFSS